MRIRNRKIFFLFFFPITMTIYLLSLRKQPKFELEQHHYSKTHEFKDISPQRRKLRRKIAEHEEGRKKTQVFSKASFVNAATREDLVRLHQRMCPLPGDNLFLAGNFLIDKKRLMKTSINIESFSVYEGGNVLKGGWWKPQTCKPRAKVAILIPFRNRYAQLRVFLRHMTPILQRQLLDYRIFVIEQTGKAMFNKGAIYNIGFNYTANFGHFDCYIFHDVDLLSENDMNYYGCQDSPVHMSPSVDTLGYKLLYEGLFGGVEAFKRQHFIEINGFSNLYWGWGAEDDDLFTRIMTKGLMLVRPSMDVGRYTMLKVQHYRSDNRNDQNIRMFYDFNGRAARVDIDGLRQISQLKHDLVATEELLYTKISIDLKMPKMVENLPGRLRVKKEYFQNRKPDDKKIRADLSP